MAHGKSHSRSIAPRPSAAAPRPAPAPPALSGPRSRALFARAQAAIPGGVNSPVRAWKRLGGNPPLIVRGKGAWIVDADRRRYIDYILSWGPLLHGHAHPQVVKAVQQAAARGLSFGAPTPAETELVELIRSALPSMERIRLVSSGTEAVMSALRVARAATGREVVIKCDGGYHGHADHLLVAAGSGCATFNQPDSSGVPAAFAALTASVPYNDLAATAAAFAKHRRNVAAVIVEPVAGNMGFVLPQPGYLEGLRALCTKHGAMLVFDEVMTGFRVAWGGWQQVCGVVPDLTCLGKVMGGGLPAAAYGGRQAVMEHLAPLGGCYQAGTLSGNPVAVAAGLANLRLAAKPGFYAKQAKRLAVLVNGLRQLAAKHGVPFQVEQAGLMWGFFFNPAPVTDFVSAARSHDGHWQTFFRGMTSRGIFLPPSPFEASFWSAAHGTAEVNATLAAADAAFAEVKAAHG